MSYCPECGGEYDSGNKCPHCGYVEEFCSNCSSEIIADEWICSSCGLLRDVCPSCGEALEEDFCRSCGLERKYQCEECENRIDKDSKKCPDCGHLPDSSGYTFGKWAQISAVVVPLGFIIVPILFLDGVFAGIGVLAILPIAGFTSLVLFITGWLFKSRAKTNSPAEAINTVSK